MDKHKPIALSAWTLTRSGSRPRIRARPWLASHFRLGMSHGSELPRVVRQCVLLRQHGESRIAYVAQNVCSSHTMLDRRPSPYGASASRSPLPPQASEVKHGPMPCALRMSLKKRAPSNRGSTHTIRTINIVQPMTRSATCTSIRTQVHQLKLYTYRP